VVLLIADGRAGSRELEPVLELATITRLGESVDARRTLAPAAVERTLACLDHYAEELASRGVTRVAAVGTSALRDAAGGAEFLDAAERKLGVRPRVISGNEEAELTFHGSLSGLALAGPVSVFDVGGGSTEVIFGAAGTSAALTSATSLDIGSVRLFERHVRHDPPLDEEMSGIEAEITGALASTRKPDPDATLVGVAGTVTTLVAIELGLDVYDSAKVHGRALSLNGLERLAQNLARTTLAERQALAGLEPKRADVIVVGAAIVRSVLAWSGRTELVVSDRGVRWGLAERLMNEQSARS
jgi:exopolyphosphatase/guanosine-5'-triphosphate,3'-diphosphate pyrophosphatase